jgi:molecular chaperone GrpE (heat shock protein)
MLGRRFDPRGDYAAWPVGPRPAPAPRPAATPVGEPGRSAPAPVPAEEPKPRPDEPSAGAEPEQTRRAEAALGAALEDLAATKRRLEREAVRARDDARAEVIAGLLPVLDSLDRSIACASGSASTDPLADGILLVRAQFELALARCGLERVESVGRPFDPAQHDAVAMVDVEQQDRAGFVVDELERGYRLAGRTVRAAKVRVARHL